MKMNIEQIFTIEQINEIRTIIMHQCSRHRDRERNYQDLIYSPYLGNRAEHSITTSIISGFRENTDIPGVTITILKYGLNEKMGQPVLKNDRTVAHIYNSGCRFTSKPFKENCKTYNTNLNNSPIYSCIVFTAKDDGTLENIQIMVPNSAGEFVESFVIFDISYNNAVIA